MLDKRPGSPLAEIQTLQLRADRPRLPPHWHPEGRARCLNAIPGIKRALRTLEEMIRAEIREEASTNGNSDVDIDASALTSLLAEDLRLNPQPAVTATGEEGVTRPREL